MDTQNLSGIEGKVMLSGKYGAGVMVTDGNSSSLNIDGTVTNPILNPQQSIFVPHPVGAETAPIKPKSPKGELIINVDYASK